MQWIAAVAVAFSLLMSVAVGGAFAAIEGEVTDAEDRSLLPASVTLLDNAGGFVNSSFGSSFVFEFSFSGSPIGAGQYWVFAQTFGDEPHVGTWRKVAYDGVGTHLQLRLARGVSLILLDVPERVSDRGGIVEWQAVLINHGRQRRMVEVIGLLGGPTLSTFFSNVVVTHEALLIEKDGVATVQGSFRIPAGVPSGFFYCLTLEVFQQGKLLVLATETRCIRKGTETGGGGGGGGGGKG